VERERARYCALNNKLVFETFREDIIGGSFNASEPHAPGVTTMFVAGPETGKEERSGTTILYVAERDGSKAYPLGAMDVVDGQNGVEIYESTPETSLEAVAPIRQKGAVLYANQNKDLGAWHPNGKWIFMGVEMKRHGLKHQLGCSEIGMFNNLWAVSIDGKIWVQLILRNLTASASGRIREETPSSAMNRPLFLPTTAKFFSPVMFLFPPSIRAGKRRCGCKFIPTQLPGNGTIPPGQELKT
jgi:hypothetical protein